MITVTSARAWAARSQGAGPVELAGRPLPGLLRAGHGLPPGFGRLMGYRPVAARLHGSPWPRLVKPAGSCSSPLGQAPFGFGVVCKAHDFGYDLLRFATRSGKGAGVPAARRLIDGQFDHDLHA